MRSFLDRVLDRDGIELVGIERRRMEDVDVDTLVDSLMEEGEDVEVAAGLEHSTSALTGCSVC